MLIYPLILTRICRTSAESRILNNIGSFVPVSSLLAMCLLFDTFSLDVNGFLLFADFDGDL